MTDRERAGPENPAAPKMIGEDGIYLWVRRAPPPAGPATGAVGRAALFLDRDGVIVEEVGHLCRPADVRLIAGAGEVIATANALAIPVVVVTNQSGIGRGLFEWSDFASVEARIAEALAALGARVDGVFACPHHRAGRPPYDHPDHPARKPNAGLLLRAAAALALDLPNSWIVGDRAGDILAGRNAGLAGRLHVLTGWGGEPGERAAALAAASGGGYRVLTADSIAVAREMVPLLKPASRGR